MKTFLSLSVLTIIFIVSAITVNVLSQENDSLVKAFNRSVNFEAEKNYTSAISELEKFSAEGSNVYLFNLRMGWLKYSTADYDGSIKYYKKAAELNPKSPEPLLGLRLPYAARNEWTEVKNIYNSIIALDPNNYEANLRLGQIALNENLQSAKSYLEKAYTISPSQYEANLSLGYTYYYLGNSSKAREHLNNALMVSENDSLAQAGLKLLK
ncbi:MAG: tetratricopeptide repeat protein [Ignavibacteriaceae bacterium]|nr:tetratricopeptide repeat protein [Ignavibacteriaceae bacterium]NUM69226.1 tetratricopeptide repeat protein [Ignavibacteriaceae bacterium]